MERLNKKNITHRIGSKIGSLISPKNREHKKITFKNRFATIRQGSQRKKTVNILGYEVIPFDKNKIFALIKTNLLKYSNSTENYYKQIVNNILIKKSRIHCFYSEMLLNIEDEEILNKFYPKVKSFDKLKFLGIINKNFLRLFPSYIGTGNEIYNIMLNNLNKKQELINKIEDNIKKQYSENNNKSIGFSFIGIDLKDIKDESRFKRKIKINCLNEIVDSEEEIFYKELQKLVLNLNNVIKNNKTINVDKKYDKNINDKEISKEKKNKFKIRRNSLKRFTSMVHKTHENEMEKILRRIRLSRQILKQKHQEIKEKKNNSKDYIKKNNNNNNNNLNINHNNINNNSTINNNIINNNNNNQLNLYVESSEDEENNNSKRNSILSIPKEKFKRTSSFLYYSRRKKRNMEEAEKVFNDILSNPIKSIIHFSEIKEQLNNNKNKNHKKNNFSENLLKPKNQIQNLKMPNIYNCKTRNNAFLSDNFQMKSSPNYFIKKNLISDNEKSSKKSNLYYYNYEDYEQNKNNVTNNFKSVESLDTNFSNIMTNKILINSHRKHLSESLKNCGNYNKYKNDISHRKINRNKFQNTQNNYIHNIQFLSYIKIN